MAVWKNPDDLEKDRWFFSEINQNDNDINEPITEPILQYNARIGANQNSIFDLDLPHEENITYLSSGRGRGGMSKIFKPGLPVNDCQEEEDDIKRRLREVSGLGYSNELIEIRFKKTVSPANPSEESEFCDIPEKDDFQIKNISPNVTSSPIDFISVRSESSRGSTPSFSSEGVSLVKEVTEENQNHPPPLSVILSRGKKNSLKSDKENSIENHSNLKSESQFVTNSILRVDAPEFKFNPRISSVSNGETSIANVRTNEFSNPEYTHIPKLQDKQSDTSSKNFITEELSWRRDEKKQYFPPQNGTLPWRQRDQELRSHPDKNGVVSSDLEFPFRVGQSWGSSKRTGNNSSFSGNRTSDSKYDEEFSYKQATLTRNENRRDYSRTNKIFDIKSDYDFPNL